LNELSRFSYAGMQPQTWFSQLLTNTRATPPARARSSSLFAVMQTGYGLFESFLDAGFYEWIHDGVAVGGGVDAVVAELYGEAAVLVGHG
jgi:hypothetical protein